jgi:hypothetical protein
MQKPLSHSTWASALELRVPPVPHVLAVRLTRLRRVETVPPCLPAQTPSLPYGTVIICAVLAALSAFRSRTPKRKAGRASAGAQIIT